MSDTELHHLLNRAIDGVVLHGESDRLRELVRGLEQRAEQAEADHARVHLAACRTAETLRHAEQRAEKAEDERALDNIALRAIARQRDEAEAVLARVRDELDRIAALDTVATDSGRANSFDTGTRWTLRMIRENALDEPQPSTATA